MDLGLADKTALVLGASRGLGAACARELALEGAQVHAAARNTGAISDWAADLPEGRVIPVELDLSSPQSVAALCERMKATEIDVLVANCGGPKAGPALGRPVEDWQAAWESMALPIVTIANALVPGMTERGFGRVVTIGSSGIESPIPNLALSNGVRGMMAGWSKTLASEVAGLGVTVNMVLPGRIGTDRVAELDAGKARAQGKSAEDVAAASRATIPTGRYGDPAEFAAVVAFLASTRASYVTGSMIRADGGLLKNL
ncbi:SDR family oxidoreductase [Pelagovum pacificum]|uniref:SDR family oxidoreductase n=1 Tax=Pelagovum pacificum TaxID=2588711 RepID=A0A5C5G7A0_9RHOB|nr:SDR family oxidoreductase [Pelagovum pacificum]QQA41980.1 SDR family oxidoreductase [Pelagovum pacificum]TNY30579.1 SDR family oxidoreductase [Pelagovum pacificum]